MAKTLAHITDLHLLDDAEVAQFAAELPGMVASLRVAARATKASGLALHEAFPSITFVPELKNATVIRADGRELQVSHQAMQQLDVAQEQTRQLIVKAKDKPTDRVLPAHITQEQLDWELLKCAANNKFHACKVLLGVGANVHASRANYLFGATPLSLAAFKRNEDLCQLLIEHGADVNAVDASNRTPIDVARNSGKLELVDMLEIRRLQASDPEMAAQMRAHNAPPTKSAIAVRQDDLDEALREAIRARDGDLCKMMLDMGADPMSSHPANYIGNSALHLAAENGSDEVCRLLVERGMDINVRNKNGQTPLYMAVEKSKNKELALMLVSLGADTNHFHAYKNKHLLCGNLNFKGMTMHTAAMRLGDLKRMTELFEDPAQPQDADFLKKLVSEAKSLKKPEITAFIQAHEAKARMNAIRASSPKGP